MTDIPTAVTVTVPGTTANIGPGFDCLGAALTLYNRVNVSRIPIGEASDKTPTFTIQISGLSADNIGTDANNLAYQSFCKFYAHIGRPLPSIHMSIEVGVPLARGLGSSATAIVGGLLAANALEGSPLAQQEVMELAIALEGHPDNVVPALLGGCQLTTTTETGKWLVCEVPWHPELIPVVAIPDFELSTAEARKVLPSNYSRADAIFNTAHMGLLMRALEIGNGEWLKAALQDRIHQPYRQTLIHHYEQIKEKAIAAGAYGMVISGAGPTLLALVGGDRADAVNHAMTTQWHAHGIEAQAKTLQIDHHGATVQVTD